MQGDTLYKANKSRKVLSDTAKFIFDYSNSVMHICTGRCICMLMNTNVLACMQVFYDTKVICFILLNIVGCYAL